MANQIAEKAPSTFGEVGPTGGPPESRSLSGSAAYLPMI